MSRRVLTLPVLVSALVVAAPAQPAPESSAAAKRPTVKVVKKLLKAKFADDSALPTFKTTLVFKSVKLQKTRKSVPARDFIEPGKWVTPVASVFVATSRDSSTTACAVYRYSFTGIFWKGDFGWTFKNRDVEYKKTADSC